MRYVISGGEGANNYISGFNGKRERKQLLGRYMSRQEDRIKVDLK